MPDNDMSIEAAITQLGEPLADAIRARQGYAGVQMMAYVTGGGTYIIASTGLVNDDGNIHDLIAIGRGGQVVPLSILTNPDSITAVRKVLASS